MPCYNCDAQLHTGSAVPISNVVKIPPVNAYPGACDAGDAFWWFLGGLALGSVMTFGVVALSDDKTIKGALRTVKKGARKMWG